MAYFVVKSCRSSCAAIVTEFLSKFLNNYISLVLPTTQINLLKLDFLVVM
jgi:hypothetical protein